MIPADTSADADAVLFARLRAMSVGERADLTRQLCRDVERIARAGILAQHPDASSGEVAREVVRRRYGETLAAEAYGAARRTE